MIEALVKQICKVRGELDLAETRSHWDQSAEPRRLELQVELDRLLKEYRQLKRDAKRGTT